MLITKSITKCPTTSTHVCTCKKKNHVICKFHYSLPPMLETKNLQSFEKNGNYPFSKKKLHTQANKYLNL